ncbi:hypothetical protein lbkm_1946 [Lachnospiraceae bacterium KM106-2]|nr:hypothetical protein lbkm_1946 [Lachnospiraceae bacterium KM106-2]
MKIEEKAELISIQEKLKLLVNELLYLSSDMKYQAGDKMELMWANHLEETALKYKKSLHDLEKIN